MKATLLFLFLLPVGLLLAQTPQQQLVEAVTEAEYTQALNLAQQVDITQIDTTIKRYSRSGSEIVQRTGRKNPLAILLLPFIALESAAKEKTYRFSFDEVALAWAIGDSIASPQKTAWVKYLLENTDTSHVHTDYFNISLLEMACENVQADIVKLLLQYNARPKIIYITSVSHLDGTYQQRYTDPKTEYLKKWTKKYLAYLSPDYPQQADALEIVESLLKEGYQLSWWDIAGAASPKLIEIMEKYVALEVEGEKETYNLVDEATYSCDLPLYQYLEKQDYQMESKKRLIDMCVEVLEYILPQMDQSSDPNDIEALKEIKAKEGDDLFKIVYSDDSNDSVKIQLLLDYGANIDMTVPFYEKPSSTSWEWILLSSRHGFTALHQSIYSGDINMVKFLIVNRANPFIKCKNLKYKDEYLSNLTPLQMALIIYEENYRKKSKDDPERQKRKYIYSLMKDYTKNYFKSTKK